MSRKIKQQMLPDFLIIGAAKAGTTSLYYYLMQHPQIFMSPKKEPSFFYLNGRKADFKGLYDREVWDEISIADFESYQALFAKADNRIKGEASTNYLYYHEEVAPCIYQYNPDMKLIVILRNPVDRAFSAFRHRRSVYREPLVSFKEALAAEAERIENHWDASAHYFRVGLYSAALETYFRVFPPEQIKILLYETDISQNIQATMQDIFGFLAVDQSIQIDSSEVHNTQRELGNPLLRQLDQFLIYHNIIQTMFRYFPQPVVSTMRHMLDKLREADEQRSYLEPELRCQLEEAYREDILKTEAIIGRDLSFWLSDDCP